MHRNNYINKLFPIFILIIFILILTKGFWTNLYNLPGTKDPDALQFLSMTYLFEKAVKIYHEFPMWNPYYGGGVPWAGMLWNPGISPYSLIIISFGHLLGLKIYLILIYLLSGLGLYLMLINCLKLSRESSVLSAMLFVSSLWFTGRFISGNYIEFFYPLLPLSIYLFYSLLRTKFVGFFLPFLFLFEIGAMAQQGIIITSGFLLLFALLYKEEFGNDLKKIISYFILFIIVSLGLASPKLVPFIEIQQLNLANLTNSPVTGLNWIYLLKSVIANSKIIYYHDTIGIGLISLLICISSFFLNPRKSFGIGIILLLAIVCTMGPFTPFSRIINLLPLLDTVQKFAKYFNGIVLFSLCVLFAISIDSFLEKTNKIKLQANPAIIKLTLVLIIFILTIFPLFRYSYNQYLKGFEIQPKNYEPEEFFHIAEKKWLNSDFRYRIPTNDVVESNMYYNLLRNRGIITWYGIFVLPEYASAKFIIDSNGNLQPNKDYMGEYQCINQNVVENFCDIDNYLFTFNKILIKTGTNFSAEKLRLNFNYNPSWKSNIGDVINDDGLLTIKLANLNNKNGNLILEFEDNSFKIGMIIFTISFIFWILIYNTKIVNKPTT